MLILPLGTHHEGQPSSPPILTILVCLICIVLHFTVTTEATKLAYAYDPRSWHVGHMVSAAFLHADLSHLFGNLFFFYCFSSTIEKEITFKGYVIIFLVFAVVTHVSYSLMTKVFVPSLGLSGVVWGFMGLFLGRFPFQKVECFVWFLWVIRRVNVPALLFVLAFLVMDVFAFQRHDSNVNHFAHFSGFLSGLGMIGFWSLLERDVKPRPAPARHRNSRSAPLPKSRQEHDWN
jgi:membrane associated rhomboid family serine protease